MASYDATKGLFYGFHIQKVKRRIKKIDSDMEMFVWLSTSKYIFYGLMGY